MILPDFQILSDTELYSNELTPLKVSALPSVGYSSTHYLWDFGDGNRSTGKTTEHVYKTVGDFNITLTQYLSSGEPVKSNSKTISVRNLIPNLMMWDETSYSGGSITASVKGSTPFIANVWNSWQQYDENSFLHLYVENSKSIPFDITDKRIHLKPNWRFLDLDDNVIETIPLHQDKIYASKIGNEIYLSTNETENSLFVGVSSQSEFYFIDDTPSGIDPTKSYLPSTIIVTQNLSGIYGDKKFTQEDYLQYPSLIKSVFIDNIVPDKLLITSNGIIDIAGIKYIDTKIPYNIRLVDSNDNFIKTNPIKSDDIIKYNMDIGFTDNVIVKSTPSFNGNTLEQFSPDFSSIGGFFESHFIPIQPTTEYVSLTAFTKIDYTINQTLTRYGIFSDENSNRIYRTSYIQGFNKEYIRKESSVIGNEFDKLTSNKFGAIVDTKYNSVFLDSDDSRIEIYDSSFELIDNISLSSYDNFILSSNSLTSYRGHPSPAQIQMDKAGGYFITLHETADLLYIINNDIMYINLYEQIAGSFVIYDNNLVIDEDDFGLSSYVVYDSDGNFLFQPAALDILSDDKSIYVAYVNEEYNFVQKYNLDRSMNPHVLSSLNVFNFSSDVPVDMVSNRDGDRIYILTTNYYTQKSFIKEYDTSSDVLLNNISVGYGAEFLTIDTDQYAWVCSKSLSSNEEYDVLYNTNGGEIHLTVFNQSNTTLNIGGITGDSYGNIWLIDSNNDSVIVFNKDDPTIYEMIHIFEDAEITTNKYVAYGDWNGFRWYNKFGSGLDNSIITYELSGQSNPFRILPRNKYNLQKINEDFNATDTLKSYRTTELMLNYDNLFDNFLGSIYGNNLDDGTYIGKNIYEKIANFVMNHADIETCSIEAIESYCKETGIDIESKLNFPRDIKRMIDLFSIKYKKLWGENYKTGLIEDYLGEELNTLSYVVSADPQVKFIAKEKFNNFYTIIDPLLIDGLSSYPLSSYDHSWGWGLSIPINSDLKDYYEFYEMLPVEEQRLISVIDWENPLTDTTIKPISSFSDYMSQDGIVSIVLGDKIRDGLGVFINN